MPHDLAFDATREPFSRYGSWLSVMWRKAKRGRESGWWLGSHHDARATRGDGRYLFRLTPSGGGDFAQRGAADAGELRLIADDGMLRVCLSGPGTARLRGEGTGAVLGGRGIAYAESSREAVVNSLDAWWRYGVRVLRGSLELEAEWSNRQADAVRPVAFRCLPDDDGIMEVVVEEHGSTWPRPELPAYAVTAESARREFAAFAGPFGSGPADPALAAARTLAVYVVWSSVVSPLGLLRRPTVLMSKVWMDQCWSWDHCFNARALAGRHDALAWDQYLALFDHQDAHGCLPDSINDASHQFCFCKPPVHGWALRHLLARTDPERWRPLLPDLYDGLAAWSAWWLAWRRRSDQRLPHYLHGNDSGWDNSTMFEDGTPLVAPDLATCLADQCVAVAELAELLERRDEAERWRCEATDLRAALLEELWDGAAFRPRRLTATGHATVQCESLIPLMPLLLGDGLPAAVRAVLLADLERFVTPAGLASEDPSSPAYTPDGYWRGPMWAPPVRLIVDALEGDPDGLEMAERIAARFCDTCARSGFAENFDALSGAGLRDPAYTWTASVFLELTDRPEYEYCCDRRSVPSNADVRGA